MKLIRKKLPVMLQAEKGECGLVCVAMIAAFHGLKTDLATLRLNFPLGIGGATLNRILGIAQELELSARALRLELEDLRQLTLPAILHWNLNHFVVLKALTRRYAIIHDPAVGVRKYSLADISRKFTGIAVEFLPGRQFPVALPARLNKLSELFQLSTGFWANVIQVLLLSVLIQLIALITPFYVQITIDQGLTRNDPDLILVIAMAFLALALIKTVISYLRGIVLLYFSNLLEFQMAGNVLRHLIRLPARYFESRHSGEIVSRFESVNQIRQLLTNDMLTVVVDGLLSLSTLIALYLYSPLLASFSLLLIVLFLLIRLLLMQAERLLRHEVIVADANQKSVFLDNIRSINTTRIYGLERARSADWQNHHVSMLNAGVDLGRLQNRLNALQILIFGIDHVVTLYFGTRLIYQAELSIGQLIGFVFLKQHFITSLNSMIPKLVEIRLVKLHLERLADITFTPAEPDLAPNAVAPRVQHLALSVRELCFRYPGAPANTLSDLSFTISPGEFVAITGPSGCGKSTLLKLLCGLNHPDQGSVCCNGVDIREFGLAEYRRHIAAILHSDHLIMGSLHYNIALGCESALSVETACELAAIREDILQLPMQFNTMVGEMTSMLSAGQIQRLLLARAIYRQPAILFIDEGFANLNDALARQVLTGLRELGASVVLVTHNPALIDCMDREISLPGQARLTSPGASDRRA